MKIQTKTPLRLTLGGGGTDLPSYYQLHGGFIFAAAINHYVKVTIEALPQGSGILFEHGPQEKVSSLDDLSHDLTREALRLMEITQDIKITSTTDIPTETGLGSSGAYCAGLLKALSQIKGENISDQDLAERACHLEMEILQQPVGKQDQYMAVYGGFTVLEISKSGQVTVQPAKICKNTIDRLNQNLLLFYSGQHRKASTVLSDQNKKIQEKQTKIIECMHAIKEIGKDVLSDLEKKDLSRFGSLMDCHWKTKKRISNKMSDPQLDQLYEKANKNGALGGKIAGAGGGGYFAFYVQDNHEQFRIAMQLEGLKELKYQFVEHGSQVIIK